MEKFRIPEIKLINRSNNFDKMYKILISFTILANTLVNAQKITNYLGKVELNKNLKNINADFILSYENKESDSISFLLNKYSKIDFIKINNKKIIYKELSDSTLPDSKKIVFTNKFPEKFNLEISYNYSLEKIEFPTFKYNKNWIELSFYTAWFPLNFDDKNYSYDLTFLLPKNYDAVSAGKIEHFKNNKINIKNNKNYKDILVVLSDKFQKFQSENKKIKFYGIDLEENLINEISSKSQNIFNFYENIFGASDSQNLIVAVNPYIHPMSYSRKGIISLSLKNNFIGQDQRTLAHEIGHLWWKNANFGTYQEWLNESFAEFSALKWSQESLPEKDFSDLLSKYENENKNSLKISQVNPNEKKWFSIIYLKGAFILYDLNKEIGNEKMNEILKQTYLQKISNTKDFIKIVEKISNKNIAENLKNKIE